MSNPTDPTPSQQVTPTPFVLAFNQLADEVHTTARAKGWWEKERNDAEALMLIVCEVAEACEALRAGNPPDDKISTYTGVEAELSDVIIRIMDISKARGWRVAEALEAKRAYNLTRSYKHGNKAF